MQIKSVALTAAILSAMFVAPAAQAQCPFTMCGGGDPRQEACVANADKQCQIMTYPNATYDNISECYQAVPDQCGLRQPQVASLTRHIEKATPVSWEHLKALEVTR